VHVFKDDLKFARL